MKKEMIWIVPMAVMALIMSGCQKKEMQEQKVPNVEVETLQVVQTPLPIWIDFVGKTKANKTVDVIARVQGRLEKIHFTQGQIVHKGDLLFSIERADYDAKNARNVAQLEQDRASLELARNDVARYRPLIEKDLAPREKLDQLISRQKEIEAMIAADKATIAQSSLSAGYTQVRAEISGKIGRNLIDIGNMVGTSPENSVLATIVNDDPMYVYFSPSNKQMQNMLKYRSSNTMAVKATQSDVILDGKVKTYSGVVDFIDNTTDLTTSTVSMRAALKNPDGTLLSGSFVDIKVFVTDQEPVLAIPQGAVSENQLGSFVYVVENNNSLRIAQIKPAYSNKAIIAVGEGLKSGDRIVVSGLNKLNEGQVVIPKPTTKNLLPKTFE